MNHGTDLGAAAGAAAASEAGNEAAAGPVAASVPPRLSVADAGGGETSGASGATGPATPSGPRDDLAAGVRNGQTADGQTAAGAAAGAAPPGATDGPPVDYGQKVPAVDQATRVLYFLAGDARGQSTLTEICKGVGIYKSKGKAILNTLRSANLVTKNEHDKTYSLGPGLLLLSRALLDQSDLTRAAAPFLEELAVEPGTLAFMTLIRDSQQYVVARSEAAGGMSVTIRVGYHYPITWGSMGKAVVAFLPEAEREALLATPPLFFSGDPGAGPQEVDAIREELEECRRTGYGADIGTITPGLVAVSAPLVGGRGTVRPVGAVSLAGAFPEAETAEHGRRVAAKAREMRVRLGPLLDDIT